jgi:hypothetical protein
VYTEADPRQSPVPCLAPVSISHSLPFNFFRIRTSKTPLAQPLCNPHLRKPLGCAGSKGLTGTRIHRQLFYNQHLRTLLGSVGNTGLIIPLESALTKNAPATPLESALTKNRGDGGNGLEKRNGTDQKACPTNPGEFGPRPTRRLFVRRAGAEALCGGPTRSRTRRAPSACSR